MRKLYCIDESEGYNQREIDDTLLEKAFKEGCEHGYKKAMKELEGYNERRPHYSEGFEEKMSKLRKKFE